jgi:hypothetical protein
MPSISIATGISTASALSMERIAPSGVMRWKGARQAIVFPCVANLIHRDLNHLHLRSSTQTC